MNKQDAEKVIAGLRAVQAKGEPVVELTGEDARKFQFVNYKEYPKDVLASFSVRDGTPFFAVVTARPTGEISFAVYDDHRAMVLSTVDLTDLGIVWTYQPSKRSGDNEARKNKFRALANGISLTIPLPDQDFAGFCAATNRAIALRKVADDSGANDWPPSPVLPPEKGLPPSRTDMTKVPGVVWQLCTQGTGATLSEIDATITALQLRGAHSARAMLNRYAQIHGCTVTAHDSGAEPSYTLTPPLETPDATATGDETAFDDLLDQLGAASLSFPAEVVASYLLALQAKRFVLLTGISGTGKTKLALEVARALEAADHFDVDEGEDVIAPAKPYYLSQNSIVVPARLASQFNIARTAGSTDLEVQVPGQQPVPMTANSNGKRWLEVGVTGAVRDWVQTNLKVGAPLILERRVDGDREWLAMRLPTATAIRRSGSQTELVAVRPDWTDKSAVLGFFNPLTSDYITTPVLQLLLRANEDADTAIAEQRPPRPYFLIFDEMNLARVEHYFSDFLSAMESGEAIHLHDSAQLEESEGIPRRLRLPSNLFVIGTVNVDETTYMFSPKVLDRAFVLEFNEVDLDSLAAGSRAIENPLLALDRFTHLEQNPGSVDDDWGQFSSVLGGVALTTLRDIHEVLAEENRHFGYRVAREVARFVRLAVEQTSGSDEAIGRALDIAVLAKILPKLHGSQADLEDVLTKLLEIANGKSTGPDDIESAKLPNTAKKLSRMLSRLSKRGFVSFIE